MNKLFKKFGIKLLQRRKNMYFCSPKQELNETFVSNRMKPATNRSHHLKGKACREKIRDTSLIKLTPMNVA